MASKPQQYQRRPFPTRLVISTHKLRSLNFEEDTSDSEERRPRTAFHLRRNLPPVDYNVRKGFQELSLHITEMEKEAAQSSSAKTAEPSAHPRRATRFGGVTQPGFYSEELNLTPPRACASVDEPVEESRRAGQRSTSMQGSSTCDDETKHSTPRPQRLRSSRKRIVRDDDDAQDPIPVAKRQRGPPTPPPTDVVDLTTPPPEFPEKLVAAVKVKVERSDSLLDRSFTMSVQPLVGKDTALLEQLQNLLRQYQASMILKRPDLEHAVLAVLRSSEIPQDVFDKFAGMCYRGVEGGAVRPNSSLGEWLKERWVQNMMNGDAGQQRAQ